MHHRLFSSLLKLVADPQCPVIQVASRFCFLQKTSWIKDSVIPLKVKMGIRLPSRLDARSVSNEPCATIACWPDKESGDRVDTILEALSPLNNPIERSSDIVCERS